MENNRQGQTNLAIGTSRLDQNQRPLCKNRRHIPCTPLSTAPRRRHLPCASRLPLLTRYLGMDAGTEHTCPKIRQTRALRPRRRENPHLKWPLQPFSLTQDLIAGPIDFIPRKPPTYTQDGPPETHRIANAHWSILEDRAHEFNVDASTIRRIPTEHHHQTPQAQRKNQNQREKHGRQT